MCLCRRLQKEIFPFILLNRARQRSGPIQRCQKYIIFTLFYYKILDLIWSVLHELIRFMAHDLGKNAGGQNVAVSRQRELSISNFPVSTIIIWRIAAEVRTRKDQDHPAYPARG